MRVTSTTILSAPKLHSMRRILSQRCQPFSSATLPPLAVGAIPSILDVKPQAKVLVVTTESIRKRRSFQFLQSVLLQRGVQVFDYAAQPNHATSVSWSSFGPDAVLQGVEIARRTGCSEVVALGESAVWQIASCVSSLVPLRDVSTRTDIVKLSKRMEAPSGAFQSAEREITRSQMPEALPLQVIPTSPSFVDMAPPRVLFNPATSDLLGIDHLCSSWRILVDKDMIAQEPVPRMELHAGLFQLLHCGFERYESDTFAEGSESGRALVETVQLLNEIAETQSTTKQQRNAMIDISVRLMKLSLVFPGETNESSCLSAFNRAYSLALASAFGLDFGMIGALLLPRLARKWPELAGDIRMGRIDDADLLGADYAQSLEAFRDALQLPSVTSTLEVDSSETFEDMEQKLAQHALAIATADYTRKVGFSVETFRSILYE